MNGTDVRNQLRKQNMKQWELAQKLNVSESTLIRWLRSDLPKDKEHRIMKAIHDYERIGDEH